MNSDETSIEQDGNWDPKAETHQAWVKRRALAGQRDRRRTLRRIEYHPGKDAEAIIDQLVRPFAQQSYSEVLDQIVVEWAASGIE